MKPLRLSALIASAALMSACANESPLLFVSKTSVGLDVSTPTTGSTEISVNFGWKSLDAAYVPVVEIIDTEKDLHLVLSGDNAKDYEKPEDANALRKEINKLQEQLKTAQQELASATADKKPEKEQKVTDLKTKITEALANKDTNTGNAIETESTVAPAIASELVTATSLYKKSFDSYERMIAASTATDEEKKLKKEAVQAQQNVVATLSEALLKSIDRKDALSVFSVVDTNSIFRESIGVGKVFATGMAAQNVSRDFNASRGCVTAISSAVAKLAASAEAADQAKAKALIEACK
ncbi:hypothetical protein [Pseudomonas sp. XK-1]|uniref:hypothetical protein n=1 Tax=Pseudomonas sp. XK-1 TaxID=3136019 RepID=UPI00311A06D2